MVSPPEGNHPSFLIPVPVFPRVDTMLEIKGFLETSFVDWPGKLCSVLFLSHCNFRCPYCHNHGLVFHPERYPTIPLGGILEYLRSFRDWIDGICITGGEPTLSKDLFSIIRRVKNAGFLVKLDTNGSNPQILEVLLEAGEVDFVSMDVKAPLDPFSYKRSTGRSIDLALIQKSIELLKARGVEYEFRMTVVPGLHQEDDIRRLGDQLRAGRRFILQNFNPENPLDPTFKNISPYDSKVLKDMERAVQEMT